MATAPVVQIPQGSLFTAEEIGDIRDVWSGTVSIEPVVGYGEGE